MEASKKLFVEPRDISIFIYIRCPSSFADFG